MTPIRQRGSLSDKSEPSLGNQGSIWRTGQAAAATTSPGSAPAYGLALDLGTGTWVNAEQFKQFVRDTTAYSQQNTIAEAEQAALKTFHDQELERASNFAQHGQFSLTSEMPKGLLDPAVIEDNQSDSHGFGGFLHDVFVSPAENVIDLGGNALNAVGSVAGNAFHELHSDVEGAMGASVDYQTYFDKGGLLTETEFNQFDDKTRAILVDRARTSEKMQQFTSAPGVKQGLEGLDAAYHGLKVPFYMIHQSANRNPGGVPLNLSNILNPMWFDGSSYAQAWRESNDSTIGNEILSANLAPFKTEQQLDDMRKHSSLYQFTSVGVELAATWNIDPVVLAGKSLGAAARISRNEMPLNESGNLFKGITERLQDEPITVRGPVGKIADIRANRMIHQQEKVAQYAREVDFSEFSDLRMFRGRTIGGQPAAYALHYAANAEDKSLLDLTWQMLHGDPKAYGKIEQLQRMTPDELKKYAPGSQRFLDSISATKTHIQQLDEESDLLTRSLKGNLLKPDSGYFNWPVHADLATKQRQITEATDTLNKYEEYGAWLELLGTKAESKSLPLLNAVNGPTFTRHFFKDNPYGNAHTVVNTSRALWLQKAGTVSMHDMNSGVTSIGRMFDQWNHLYGYADPVAKESALHSWNTAATNTDRYKVMFNLEEEHLPKVIASHFPVDEDLARALVQKIHSEQNAVKRGVLSGNGSVYSSAPSLAQRISNPEDMTVSLVNASEDGKTMTLNLMDGRQHKVTLTVPKEALEERISPVDVTQTPNYYTPLDQRRLFLELKRHEDMLDVMSASLLERKGADLADAVDAIGTRFNNFWKPLQLFRLGWPQRVLMDEMSRAVAVMGPMYLLNGAGGEAAYTAARNVPAYWRKRWNIRHNGKVNIGDGALERATRQSPNPFMRETEASQAVKLPEVHWPVLNKNRLTKMDEHNANWSAWSRNPKTTDPAPAHPVIKVANSFKPAEAGNVSVYDAVTGNRINSGLVVPIPDPSFAMKVPTFRSPGGDRKLAAWYEKHSELLGREGMRIIVDKNGVMRIGRVYRPKHEALARDFLRMVHKDYPGSKMYDIEHGVQTHIELSDELAAADKAALEAAKAEDAARLAARANEELSEQERAVLDFDFDADSAFERTRRSIMERRQFGAGQTTYVKGGRRFTVDNAFNDHEGEIFKGLMSSDPTFDVVREGHGRTLDMFHKQSAGHKVIAPPAMTGKALEKGTKENKKAVLYFQRYADMVNDQIANSPIWSKMLKGWDDAKIVHWLEETHEGGVVQREVMRYGQHPELWVNEHRAKLNYYLPDPKLQRLLSKGRLDPSVLRKNVHNADLPSIFGPDLEVLDKRKGFGKFLNNAADKIWHSLGTVPVDTLSRHPFAKAMYDMKMRSLINVTDEKWLTPETIERFQRQSRDYAMTQVKRTLWDLTDQTNFTDVLRFVSPFWGAQQEAIVKWLRIISDRPETVGRFFAGQKAVYNNLLVIDENGEPTKIRRGMYGLPYNPTDRVVLSVPKSLTKHLGPLQYISDLGIPISSANTVLQGEMPLMPAPGPLLTVPANQFYRFMDDKQGVTHEQDFLYRWLFPIGRPHSSSVAGQFWEQIAPGYGRRIASAVDQDSVAYQNQYMQMAREMTLKSQREGKTLPTPGDIKKATDLLFGVRIFASLVSPVQVEFRPQHQYFVDAYHKYQREYGLEAWDKFVDEYHEEAAIYATSSSNSPVGVPPTNQGMEEWSQNKGTIAKYPEWGSAILSPQAYTDDFSSDAYYAQSDISTGPGSSVKLREFTDPATRLKETNEKLGWREFRKFNSAIYSELEARGLDDIRQAGAQDLAQLKVAFLGKLTTDYPDWREAYDNYASDIYSRVNELEQWVGDSTFDNRPDIQGARQYLIIRDQVARQLDYYAAATGGSRNLQAEENGALADWFYRQVGGLIKSNPAFGEFYARWLDSDDLSMGGGGWLDAE